MSDYTEPAEEELKLAPEQQRICQGLMRIDEKASMAYRGALKVLRDHGNPDRFSQAAHSLREITNIVSRQIALPQKATNEDRLRQKLEKQFTEDIRLLPSSGENEAKILIRKWGELHDVFTALSHHGKSMTEAEFFSGLSQFEELLLLFLKPIPETLKEIDSILSIQSPTEEDVKRLVEILKHPVHVEYFFSRLTWPNWFVSLRENAFFSKTPGGILENGYVMFTAWPQSRYLIKVAEQKPREVMDILKNLEKTENFRVHIDSVNCALRMCASVSKEIVPLIKRWMTTPYSHFITDDLIQLLAKLSNENEVESALDLLQALLNVTSNPTESRSLLKETQSYLDLWNYKQIVNQAIPIILEKEPLRVVETLSVMLLRAIEIERSNETSLSDDFSDVWRPAIETNEQNREDMSAKDALVTALRDSLEKIGKAKPERFKECYHSLSKFDFPVFRRLELHLMRVFPELLKSETLDLLARRELFGDTRLWHEYYHLLREQYANLPEDLKTQILGWIEKGPNLVKSGSESVTTEGPEIVAGERVAYNAHWQIGYLSALKDSISPEWKKRWKELVANYGEPEHPDFHVYMGPVEMGPKSPLTMAEMRTKSPEENVNYLKTWVPSDDPFASSREGLGLILGEVISENPSDYLRVVQEFKVLSPVYIYHLLKGYENGTRKEKAFDWNNLISFCKDILAIPEASISPSEDKGFYDWKNVKRAIADLLEEGLKSKKVSPQFQLREAIWEITQALLGDDEPDETLENKFGKNSRDLVSLSLNTVRGKATHVVFHYALWCARCLDLSQNENRMVPEVEKQLEKALNPRVEPTRTIRILYGLYLPTLFYLNRIWTERHLPDILQQDGEDRSSWRVVWEAYVTYSHPYDDVYRKLRDQYRTAINRMDSSEVSKDANRRLSEHLIIAYVRELEELIGDSLIGSFFEKAQDEVRRHAIWFAGKVLRDLQESNVEGETREKFIKRTMSLWEWRIEKARRANGQARERFVQELKEFGMWFIDGTLDKTWAIYQLKETLELTKGELEFNNNVIKSLLGYTKEHHLEVLRVLILLVRGDKKGLLLLSSKEKIAEIMESITKEHSAHEIKDSMNELVDALTRRRSFDFMKFLVK